MLRSRVIPCLLVHKKGLVKTRKFADPKYVGDPINAVKIFNEKEVDELMVLDIDASINGSEPDYKMISYLANECRMPLCYGGGVKTADQAKKLIQLGVEKVAMSSALVTNPNMVGEIADKIGAQSVVAVIDVKKSFWGGYDIYTMNGKKKSKLKFVQLLSELNGAGVGEIVVNSIDNDGEMTGYDIKLAELSRMHTECPLTVLGGAGSYDDIHDLVKRFGIIGAGAGSLFVFKGKYRAVLINYLSAEDKLKIQNNNAERT